MKGLGKYNRYDVEVSDLLYYANDKRRSQDYRTILAIAANTLADANFELKECQRILKRYSDAFAELMRAAQEIREYMAVLEQKGE